MFKCMCLLCIYILFFFFKFFSRDGLAGPILYYYFVMKWAHTLNVRAGFVFMTQHLQAVDVIGEWMDMLPKDAAHKFIGFDPLKDKDFYHRFIFNVLAGKWVRESRKEQSLQGRCREVIQEKILEKDIDTLPLPRQILNYIKEEKEPTLCFRILEDIEPHLILEAVEDTFTV